MIENIPAASQVRGWRITEFEHEIDWGNGVVSDLKADYGLVSVAIETREVVVRMRSMFMGDGIALIWKGMQSAAVTPTGPIIPDVEDGLAGIIGIRLMNVVDELLEFELEADWFRMAIRCQTFEARQC